MGRSIVEIMDDMDRLEKVEVSDELIEILKEHFKEEIEAEKLGPSMATKQISDVEAFVQETEEARRIPLSKEDIENINNLSREVEN